MMKRKTISFTLVLAILLSLIPVPGMSALASEAVSDMDALTALGIDTGAAPEGFDPYSTENPFGKNTVKISPVYELYKVGLAGGTSFDTEYNAADATLQNGENTESHAKTYSNTLQSTLHGHEAWEAKTAENILNASLPKVAAEGVTTAAGNYTLISNGEVDDTSASNIPAKGYLKGAKNASTLLGEDFKYALSDVAAGNFNGNTSGLSGQTVMVYTSELSSSGGLYLRFGDAKTGTYGDRAKELLSATKKIGNPELKYEDKLVEDFAGAPYQLQNYLQAVTGDWNGDGLDEVAVYIPEVGNSRIAVYALQLTGADNKEDAYLNPAKWSVVWTYYLREGDVVSNMVSLVSGDVNKDGIDDLAAAWGYYYGPTQNAGSTAVVMFGSKGTSMLNKSQQFDLNYGSSNIVRASFAFGDMAGSSSSGEDSDVLILCGQSDADLKAGNTYSRYVALYDWNGQTFASNIKQNFNLFEQKDGDYVWAAMAYHNNIFYSLPLCTANAAVISQGVSGGGDLLYFDSLIIEYTDEGLNIMEAWDNQAVMQQNPSNPVEYVEYAAAAGDLTGQTGAGVLAAMTQTLSSVSQETASYVVKEEHPEPVYKWDYYYKNWFYKLFDIKTWFCYISHYVIVTEPASVNVGYDKLTPGKVYMIAADLSSNYHRRTQEDFSTSICLANTDSDSGYMSYSGKHYYTYTDPQVLAVLASPPYFSDLTNRDDLSGNYAESTTSYSKTSGSGSGYGISSTISLGAYVSYEQDIEVFGVKVASVEAEAAITSHFTFDMEQTSVLEQTVTYSAAAGEDMVAFYSIPMEIYEYTSFVPDGTGGYRQVITTVNIPHEAAVKLISLKEYESIAEDYSVLPAIADNALTHVIGNPSTYPAGTGGYNLVAQYTGDPSAVGFSSTDGGSSIVQEIAMSNETNTAFSTSVEVEAKAGAGAGGFKVGVIAGAEVGAGLVLISTDGSSFSGEMQNMPIEAKPYKYGMNWRIFCYKYSDGGTSFPVVSYIVSDVQNPAPLPGDFEQDIANTTSDSITLTWSYDKMVAGFRLYRYYEFPDGSGSYELAYVPFTKAESHDPSTGTYYFSYSDENLSPYTEYLYQIQTVRAVEPKESICSEPMSCRTKTEVGYPTITIEGLVDGRLPIYPDADSTVTVIVADADSYSGLSYQWQKLNNGIWRDISGKIGAGLTISNAGAADNSTYRCRINAIYYDESTAANYYISAYSDAVTTVYSKRTPIGALKAEEKVTIKDGGDILNGIRSDIELYSGNTGHSAAPTGNVTFTVTGTDYKYSETVALATSPDTKYLGGSEKYYSTASLSIDSLPDGVYTVTAYYSGSRVFKDMETAAGNLVVVGAGGSYRLSLSQTADGSPVTKFIYGDNIWPSLAEISKDINGDVLSTAVTGAAFKIVGDSTFDFTAGSPAPDVGSYTIQASVGGDVAASLSFTVSKKQITIYVEDKANVSAGHVEENPPVIKSNSLTAGELSALKLSYTVINSAGNQIMLDNSTEPGKYTITACMGGETPAVLYNNYNVTYVQGTYTIIGAIYRLTVVAALYSDSSGTRPVGTAGISNAPQTYADYTAGTAVVLYASPQAGYQVDTWTALFENNTVKTQSGGTTYTLTTEAQKVTVTVTFKPSEMRLSTIVQPSTGGIITCYDEYFSSGAYVSYGAEYTFTAIPAEGYHFSKWQTVSGGTTRTPEGTAGPDGSNTLTVTVDTASMTVYAMFDRDSYTLVLDGNIEAYYMYDDDGVPTTDPIKRMVPNGGLVPGDTEITVQPKTGYQAAEGAHFIINGITTDDAACHRFKITGNTTVSLATERNSYTVSKSAVNGFVSVTINGLNAGDEDLNAVDGGAKIIFTARADRGYIFDHWTLNGTTAAGSTDTLIINELGGNADVTAVFEENTAYTVSASVSVDSRGTMNYTLYDIYGEPAGEENAKMPPEGITVYKDESIVLSVDIMSGSMMEQWKVNGKSTYTTQKTYTVDDINGNIDATAYLKAASKYSVYFLKMGEGGSSLSATADGESITSGDLQFGGSRIVFSAAPENGYMVDYWTITDGVPAAAESGAALDSEGNIIVAPVYEINPLKKNITVRSHFTVLETNTVTISATSGTGISAITYVTPINPGDDGSRNNLSTETVRNGGTVRMTFSPNSGYGTSESHLITAIRAAVTTGASISVKKDGGVYTATISSLKRGFTLMDGNLYYPVHRVILPSTSVRGISSILYGDDVIQDNAASAIVRHGGTVSMTFSPNSGYGTSESYLKSALKAAVTTGSSISVKENQGIYTATVSNLQRGFTFTEEELYYPVPIDIMYTITVPGGVTASVSTAKEGDTVTLTVTPAKNYKLSALTLNHGTLNETVSSSRLVYSFKMPDADVIVGIEFEYSAPGGEGGGGGSGGGLPEKAKQTVRVFGNGEALDISVVVNNGIAGLEIDGRMLSGLISSGGTVTIDLSSYTEIKGVVIPNDALGSIEREDAELAVYLHDARVTFDAAAIAAIRAAGNKDVILTAAMVEISGLTAEQRKLVGDRPVIELTLSAGDSIVFDFDAGSAEVIVPYTLKPGEDPDSIVVWHLNNKGILEAVTGRYDAAAGAVVFTVRHFSKYVIGFLPFEDIDRSRWYFDSVSFAYANGLFSGISDTEFKPEVSMTRAMLVTVLWRLEGEPDAGAGMFTDVPQGAWYAEAVNWASEKGIAAGYGDGIFGTDDAVTREQIALIIMNYARYKHYDVSSPAALSGFSDSESISHWANAAMEWANAENLISGMGNGTINPKGNAARCQVAAILQRFTEHIVK